MDDNILESKLILFKNPGVYTNHKGRFNPPIIVEQGDLGLYFPEVKKMGIYRDNKLVSEHLLIEEED